MNNVYTDPYMPDEEDMVTVGDLRPYGHEVKYKQHIDQRTLKQRAKEKKRAESDWYKTKDKRPLCHTTSPWADSIEHWKSMKAKHHEQRPKIPEAVKLSPLGGGEAHRMATG